MYSGQEEEESEVNNSGSSVVPQGFAGLWALKTSWIWGSTSRRTSDQEEQCGLYPGRGTLDQVYTLTRVDPNPNPVLEGHRNLDNQSTWKRVMIMSPEVPCGRHSGDMELMVYCNSWFDYAWLEWEEDLQPQAEEKYLLVLFMSEEKTGAGDG